MPSPTEKSYLYFMFANYTIWLPRGGWGYLWVMLSPAGEGQG